MPPTRTAHPQAESNASPAELAAVVSNKKAKASKR
jgi:hypothetical protein